MNKNSFLVLGLLVFSMFLIMSSSVNAIVLKDQLVENPRLNGFLSILGDWSYAISNEATCMAMDNSCAYWSGTSKNSGWAILYKNCVWDGSCKCDSYMNDESLFKRECGSGSATTGYYNTLEYRLSTGYCEDCTYGDGECDGSDFLECHGCQYANQGEVDGECGVFQECSGNDRKCEGSNYFICVRESWRNIGKQTGYCNVECVYQGDCDSDEKCDDNLCKANFICDDNEKKCSDDNLIICRNNQWEVKENCAATCLDGACVSTPDTPPITGISSFFSNLWSWIKYYFGGSQ